MHPEYRLRFSARLPITTLVVLSALVLASPLRAAEPPANRSQATRSAPSVQATDTPLAAPLSAKDQALREAAAQGDAPRTRDLLKQGANANSVDEDGITPLMIAVVGNVERVRALAEKGLGEAWQKGLKKVVKAMRGDAATAAALLDGGAEPNAQARRGVSPLALAVLGGKPEVVALLLDRGADPNARATRGETALMVASVAGHAPVVKLLLERGADPLAQSTDGITPALAAILGGHPEIVELLAKGMEKKDATF